MQKIFNTILLIIFLVLVALFAYKTLKTPETSKAPVNNAPIEQSHSAPTEETLQGSEKPATTAAEIDQQIHDYIINHPEVLLESIEQMQKKKIEETDKQAANYLLENKASIEEEGAPPYLGNRDGDITIVVFYDYNCSYCKQANEFTNKLLETDPGVKIILRPIPILGGTSMYASKVALAVHKIAEEKFGTIHNEIMNMKPITEESVKALLLANKIDYAIVDNEINSFSVKQLIAKNFDLAKSLGIKGAPSYVVNGIFIPGLIDTEKFTAIIAELRQIAAQTKDQEATPAPNKDEEAQIDQIDEE